MADAWLLNSSYAPKSNAMSNWGKYNAINANVSNYAPTQTLASASPDYLSLDYWLGSGDQKVQALSPLGQGVGALSGLMSMWNGYQANQLAKKQFEFQKQAFNTNMAAAKTSYNNSLTNQANRMAARGDSALNGMTADQYVSKYGV